MNLKDLKSRINRLQKLNDNRDEMLTKLEAMLPQVTPTEAVMTAAKQGLKTALASERSAKTLLTMIRGKSVQGVPQAMIDELTAIMEHRLAASGRMQAICDKLNAKMLAAAPPEIN